MAYTEARIYEVEDGDGFFPIARDLFPEKNIGVVARAIAKANRMSISDDLFGGYHLIIPDFAYLPDVLDEPDPEPEPVEPEPEPEPVEPPAPVALSTDVFGLRTNSRPSEHLLDAMTETLGYPLQRLDFIPSAHNPRSEPLKKSPVASIEWFEVKGQNYVIDHLVELNIAAGRKGSDLVISVAFPLGLREKGKTPKDAASAKKVRDQLAEVAAGTYKWGYASAATDNKDYLADCVEPFADAMAVCRAHVAAKYGPENVPQFTVDIGWECWGFGVFTWSSSGVKTRQVKTEDNVVVSNGHQIVTENGAYWHVDHAIPEFVAAFKRVGDIFIDNGISLSMCGDKRALDVIDDPGTQWHGRCISDILCDELGEYIVATDGLSGPAYWGADWYIKPFDNFDVEHRPHLTLTFDQGRRLGAKWQVRECGVGTGVETEELTPAEEDAYDTFGAARLRELHGFFDEYSDQVGEVILYHPNNRHKIAPGSEQRAFIMSDVLGAADPSGPIYEHEV